MAIQMSCPNCDATYTLADTQSGKKVRCRKCSEIFVVGGARDDAAATKNAKTSRKDALQDSPRPPAKSLPPKSKPAAVRRDRDREDDEDDEDDEPDRKLNIKKKSGSSMPMILMIVGGVVLLLLACGGVSIFAVYYWVSSTVSNGVNQIADNMQKDMPQPGDSELPQLPQRAQPW